MIDEDIRYKIGDEFMTYINNNDLPMNPYGHHVDNILKLIKGKRCIMKKVIASDDMADSLPKEVESAADITIKPEDIGKIFVEETEDSVIVKKLING